jgi:hypothetical protein
MKKNQNVLITTKHRGVFFGRYQSHEGTTFTISNARNCIYWSKDTRGFLGLASAGPSEHCRIGPKVNELTLFDVTSVSPVTDKAAERWEVAPWR